ncbi:MAG: RecX family transcriptional regulator [Oscillospiraceae bacterium]|nr:RecX family transcriptional regulator [Oscillospiraceae bacterium]
MRIKSVSEKPDRAARFRVELDSGRILRLYRQTVEDFGLYPGLELSDARLEELTEAAGKMSAKMRAVRIVSASSVSKRDLEERLVRKGEDPNQAKEAVQWMSDLNLVDDAQTAAQIVSRCAAKGYGPQRAKQALYEKRIPKEYWQDALADYPDQTERIIEFLHSRLGSSWEDRDLKRAIDALLRRGHSYSEIQRALRQLQLDLEDLREE